jgi:hypothetical protein
MPKGVYARTKPIWNKGLTGIHLSPDTEFKKGVSHLWQIGKKLSESHRANLRLARVGMKFSEEHKKNIRKSALRGEKNPNWKGGMSRGYKTGYYSTEYKNWRRAVFERDAYSCQMPGCELNCSYVEPHHVKTWSGYPQLRFVVNNGITLCVNCHRHIYGREGNFMNLFSKILQCVT